MGNMQAFAEKPMAAGQGLDVIATGLTPTVGNAAANQWRVRAVAVRGRRRGRQRRIETATGRSPRGIFRIADMGSKA